ncbi:MAG: cadherin-like domain-containing protein [Alsobacter sp.]
MVLAAADIGITDPDSTAFTYTVSGVTHGSFETLVGATWGAATSFTSAQLAAGGVRFVHDGSEIAPTFSPHRQ